MRIWNETTTIKPVKRELDSDLLKHSRPISSERIAKLQETVAHLTAKYQKK